ncbi:unnamed protein product [Phaeothamnion confervicola]
MGRRANRDDEVTLQIIEGIEDADDPRLAWGAVKRRIETLRAAGHEVPEALVVAERQLMTDFMAESQGR